MTEQEFIKNFNLVENWVNSMRPHWTHLKGDVHNDKDFWNLCIHSVKADVWTAWCEIYGDLNQSQPHLFKRHSYIYEDSVIINTRLDQGQPMSKPYNKTGYNKSVFRAAMAIKDIVADVTERPFLTSAALPVVKRVKPTAAEVQLQWAKTKAMMDQLFEDAE